jgi:hypothetical protein
MGQHVEIVVLDRLRDWGGYQLIAQLGEAGRERAQPFDLLALER